MMSIEAVFPAIGGIGIRLIGTTVTFALTAGSSVGAGVAPTGRLACAGTVSTVCVAHCDGLAAAVAAGAEADGAAAGVAGALHPVTITAAAAKASARRDELIMSCPPRKSRLVSSLSSSRQYACAGPNDLGHRAARDRGERGDESGIGVRHPDAPVLEARRPRLRGRRDVEVVEDLEVIGEELHRRHEYRAVARARELGEDLTEVRAQPFLGGVAGALIRPAPASAVEAGRGRDALAGGAQLGDVLAVALEDAPREAVRREHDRRSLPVVAERLTDASRERLDEERLRGPGARDAMRHVAERLVERAHVTAHEEVRPLRREDDAGDSIGAARDERGRGARDGRLGEPHPRRDAVARPERALQRGGLTLGARDERRAADNVVPARHLGDELGARRPTAAHRGEVTRQVGGAVGRAVRAEHDARAQAGTAAVSSWTSSARRASVAASG